MLGSERTGCVNGTGCTGIEFQIVVVVGCSGKLGVRIIESIVVDANPNPRTRCTRMRVYMYVCGMNTCMRVSEYIK